MVGGGHPEVLRIAAARAGVVGLSGLGRTLPNGHQHDVRWSTNELDAQLRLIRAECERSGTAPEIEALVHVVNVTNDRPRRLCASARITAPLSPMWCGHRSFLLAQSRRWRSSSLIKRHDSGSRATWCESHRSRRWPGCCRFYPVDGRRHPIDDPLLVSAAPAVTPNRYRRVRLDLDNVSD